MDNYFYSAEFWTRIFGGGGLIVLIISIATLIFTRVDKYRERKKADEAKKKADKDQHVSETAAIRQIEVDKDKATFDRLWKMLEDERSEVDDLKRELSDLADKLKISLENERQAQVAEFEVRKMHIEDLEKFATIKRENDELAGKVSALRVQLQDTVEQYERMLSQKDKDTEILKTKLDGLKY